MPSHIAMCGLNCSKCATFIATQKDDGKLRAKIAAEWTARHQKRGDKRPPILPEEINCRGCLSRGPIYEKCQVCAIRACGLEKGIRNCRECPDYKCGRLLAFAKRMW